MEQRQLGACGLPNLPFPLWHRARTASDRLGPADLAVLAPLLR